MTNRLRFKNLILFKAYKVLKKITHKSSKLRCISPSTAPKITLCKAKILSFLRHQNINSLSKAFTEKKKLRTGTPFCCTITTICGAQGNNAKAELFPLQEMNKSSQVEYGLAHH